MTYNPQNEQLSGNLGGQHEIQREFLLSWWKILYEKVWPQLTKNNQVGDFFICFVWNPACCVHLIYSAIGYKPIINRRGKACFNIYFIFFWIIAKEKWTSKIIISIDNWWFIYWYINTRKFKKKIFGRKNFFKIRNNKIG